MKTKDEYLKKIKSLGNSIADKLEYIKDNINVVLPDYFRNDMYTVTDNSIDVNGIDIEDKYSLSNLTSIHSNIYSFLDIYVEYHYLSNLNIDIRKDNFILEMYGGSYDDNIHINIEKNIISIGGMFNYTEKTSVFYDKYHIILREIYEENMKSKIKTLFSY